MQYIQATVNGKLELTRPDQQTIGQFSRNALVEYRKTVTF